MPILDKFKPLMVDYQKTALNFLETGIKNVFDNADAALLSFAEKAENNLAQSHFFEAMNEVRHHRRTIEEAFITEIRKSFEVFPDNSENEEDTQEDLLNLNALALIETEDYEEDVALKNALSKLNRFIQEDMFALRQRLSIIIHCMPVSEKQAPAGPDSLSRAFKIALSGLQIDSKVKLVFIALFDKYILRKISPVYQQVNKSFIAADVLPNLKYEIKKSGGNYSIPVPPLPSSATDNLAAGSDSKQSREALGEELFGTICQLLANRNTPESQPYEPRSAAQQITDTEMKPVLIDSIGEVQKISLRNSPLESQSVDAQPLISVKTNSSEQSDETIIESLKETIRAEKETIFNGIDRRQLPSADTDVIDLVGMIFEYMVTEKDLPSKIKTPLSRLHTPFLKVAIIDRKFFTRNSHPARRLLDTMINAGIYWTDTNNLETGIYPDIVRTVENVLSGFDKNVTIFEELYEDFTQCVARLEEKSLIIERRTNEAAKGQDRLFAARNRAQQEVNHIIQSKEIAKPACDLLQKLWTDKLTFMLLRDSNIDKSREWQQTTLQAVDIVNSTQFPVDENTRETLSLQLESMQQSIRDSLQNVHHAEKEALLQALFKHQYDILKDSVEKTARPAPPPIQISNSSQTARPAKVTAKKDLNEEETRILEMVNSLPFGTWFEFRDDATGKTQKAKLSWRSMVTKKYMFVDQMGLKAAVIAMSDLAKAIATGTTRIMDENNQPFVDRALSSVQRSLNEHSSEMNKTAQN
ncbi:MAG: DUF1631 family protein [Gammaproteobacteria bacterium]